MNEQFFTALYLENGRIVWYKKSAILVEHLPRPANLVAGSYFGSVTTVNQQGQVVTITGVPWPTVTTTYYSFTLDPATGLATASTTPTGTASRLATYVTTVQADTVETTLATTTLIAGQLTANNDAVEAVYSGQMINVAGVTFRIRVYFGGTVFYDTTVFSADLVGPWGLRATVIRVSASVVRCAVFLYTHTDPKQIHSVLTEEITGLTLANTQILKITCILASAGVLGDLTLTSGYLEYKPA